MKRLLIALLFVVILVGCKKTSENIELYKDDFYLDNHDVDEYDINTYYLDVILDEENDRLYVTGEIIYLEHSIDVSEASYDPSIQLIGGVLLDVTDNILYQEQIQYLAEHDTLTGTNNRNYFEDYTTNQLPSTYSVLIFDLDGLKLTNDAFGHYEGDKVIKVVANFLKDIFSESLFISRIGGDEFVVLSLDTDYDVVTGKANKLEAVIKAYNEVNTIKVAVSKGGVTVIDGNLSFDKAFVQAENIMYRRKLNSRSSRKAKMSINAVKTMRALQRSRASEIEDIELLAKVHDIGKITIPDEVLHKQSKLSPAEYELIKKHSEAGYKITRNITDSDDVCNGVLFHHEHWDGSGYPQGRIGDDIPLFARVICVVDSFDAMTNDRIYQPRKTEEEAIEELIRCSGSQFDPKVVKSFLKACYNIEYDYKGK